MRGRFLLATFIVLTLCPVAFSMEANSISHAQAEFAKLERGEDISTIGLLRVMGNWGTLLLGLSVLVLSSAIYAFTKTGRAKVFNEDEHEQALQFIKANDHGSAIDSLTNKTAYAKILNETFDVASSNTEELKLSVADAFLRTTHRLESSIAPAIWLGAVATLIGALGTLTNLANAFAVSARAVAAPKLLYMQSFKALSVGTFGILIGGAAYIYRAVLTFRMERSFLLLSTALTELLKIKATNTGGK